MATLSRGRWRLPLGLAGALILCNLVVLFVLVVTNRGSASRGASPSTGGPTWTRAGLDGVLVHSLAVSTSNPMLAFAGTHSGLYRRDPSGGWTSVLNTIEVWDVVLLPDNRTVLAADNDGYVSISHDAGAHWRRSLLNVEGAYAVSVQPGNPHMVLAGAAGGIYLSRDGGTHWRRTLALTESAADTFAWKPGKNREVFAGAVAGSPRGSTLVYLSRDAGLSWQPFGRRLQSTGGVMSVAVSPSGGVYAGTMGNAVWKTILPDGVWQKVAVGMPPTNDHVASMTGIPGRPRILVAATLGHGLFRSGDAGARWTDISGNIAPPAPASTVLSVVYAPLQRTLYAGTADGLFATTLASALKVR